MLLTTFSPTADEPQIHFQGRKDSIKTVSFLTKKAQTKDRADCTEISRRPIRRVASLVGLGDQFRKIGRLGFDFSGHDVGHVAFDPEFS